MLTQLRKLLTRLNILNGERSLKNILGKFETMTAQLQGTVEQLEDEVWTIAGENDKLREQIKENMARAGDKRLSIDHANRLRVRLEDFVS